MNIKIEDKTIVLKLYNIKIIDVKAQFENIINGDTVPYYGGPRLLVVDILVEVPERNTNEPIILNFRISREFWPHQKVEEEIKSALLIVLEHELDEQLFINGKRIKDPHTIENHARELYANLSNKLDK